MNSINNFTYDFSLYVKRIYEGNSIHDILIKRFIENTQFVNEFKEYNIEDLLLVFCELLEDDEYVYTDLRGNFIFELNTYTQMDFESINFIFENFAIKVKNSTLIKNEKNNFLVKFETNEKNNRVSTKKLYY